ncbi:hypothetical protein WJX75_005675 [Coccomyxa subellipsoidea]|uniref:Uncharacterized protein n=1 Tax=Coccomyxa subellipsoidea TaxID=248742 RepID=A0ABR2YGF5_9CHLO
MQVFQPQLLAGLSSVRSPICHSQPHLLNVGHSRDGGGDDGEAGGLRLPWNPFLLLAAGIQARADADPSFLFKLGCECGLDLAIILSVNFACRREKFVRELDFVLSQCCVSLLCDFALVYLLAPTMRQSVAAKGRLSRKIAALPSHVFQLPPPGQPGFTLAQRAACFGVKAAQYGAVGFVMGCTGSALVHAMTAVRERFDSAFEPPPTEQPIAGTGLGWLYFMGLNSNLRYNALNAAEDVLYARFPGPRSKLLSVVLRLGNNFFGAHAWMGCAKALNLNRPRAVRVRKQENRFLDPTGSSLALS